MDEISGEDLVLAYAFGVGCSSEEAAAALGEGVNAVAGELTHAVREHAEAQVELEGGGLFVALGGLGLDPMTGEPAERAARILYFPRAQMGRETRVAQQGAQPFPYFGHGVAYSPDRLEIAIGFEHEPTRAQKAAFEASIPEPLGIVFAWGPRGVHFGSDGSYEVGAKMAAAAAQGEPVDIASMSAEDIERFAATPEEWAVYENLLEDWLRRVHEVMPISFVFKPTTPDFERFSEWHHESAARWIAMGEIFDESMPDDVADWVRRANE